MLIAARCSRSISARLCAIGQLFVRALSRVALSARKPTSRSLPLDDGAPPAAPLPAPGISAHNTGVSDEAVGVPPAPAAQPTEVRPPESWWSSVRGGRRSLPAPGERSLGVGSRVRRELKLAAARGRGRGWLGRR